MRLNTGIFLLCAATLLLSGCGASPIKHKEGGSSVRTFKFSDIAKTDVDRVSEITQHEAIATLRALTLKLYRRNPQSYYKAGLASPEAGAARIFDHVKNWPASSLMRSNWEENIKLAFREDYEGDRVYALMSALLTMTMASYNHQTEFFITDSLDAQKLYNSARNLEAVVWKLSNMRQDNGTPVLLTNSQDGEVRNLSYERLFGKVIAQQDLLALIMEDKTNRTIGRVLQSSATFVLLPI